MNKIRRAALAVFAWVFLSATLCAGDVKNVIWVIGDGMGPEAMGFFMQGVRYAGLEEFPGKVSNLEKLMNRA